MKYTTREGDSLDEICFRFYGERYLEALSTVLDANQGLAEKGLYLKGGESIELPDITFSEQVSQSFKAWD
jgi:phage tail protein X